MSDRIHILRKEKNRGFTLVEMAVVLAMLSIILATSVIGLVSWQRWANFNRQNEYAKSLFVAAQNQLTEYSENGELDSLKFAMQKNKTEYKNVLKVDKLTNGDGKKYELKKVWYESGLKNDEKYQESLCYAMCEKGDYDLYKNGQPTSSDSAKIVFELLENYVYDTSILNNTISIEFTPTQGQVFAVCFSDINGKFVYEGNESSLSGTVNICDRSEEIRMDRMVGYYGADTLAVSTEDQKNDVTIDEAKLVNDETLHLDVKLASGLGDEGELNYEIGVYDKDESDGKNKILSFTIPGSSLHNYDNRNTVTATVNRYTYDASSNCQTEKIGNYDILAWIDSDQKVSIVLDASDVRATSKLYRTCMSDTSEKGLKGSDAAESLFANTLSFHRFGVDAENVYCSVQVSGDLYNSSSVENTNAESAYFDESNITLTKEGLSNKYLFDYKISNGRHLNNIRFVEDIDVNEQVSFNNKLPFGSLLNVSFEVKNNIDWQQFIDNKQYYCSDLGQGANYALPDNYSIEMAKSESETAVLIPEDNVKYASKADFISFKELRYGDYITGKKTRGENSVITGISICETSNLCFGTNISDDDDYAPTGLFIQNFGEIEYLNLDKISVKGSKKVGSFCGTNYGTITNLKTLNTQYKSEITGVEHVGGILGYQAGIVDDSSISGSDEKVVDLQKLENYAKVQGTKYVGGILGQIKIPDDKNVSVKVLNCKNKGGIVAVPEEDEDGVVDKISTKYLGGITGLCENNTGNMDRIVIKNCVSSPEYSEEDLVSILNGKENDENNTLYKHLNGVYVGGIVGYNCYGSIIDCNTEPDAGKTGYVFGYEYVGGIIGFNQGTTDGVFGDDTKKQGVNSANVVGYQYVGGITGCSAAIKNNASSETDKIVEPDSERHLDIKISNWINKGLIYAGSQYAGGITGYNTGWIYNCNSEVESNEVDEFFRETYSGDFAGGIAGYNNGIIGNTERYTSGEKEGQIVENAKKGDTVLAVCYISGTNYVGGIVGFNDEDAIVEDFEVSGGYIYGKGCYVGGYAGLNSSIYLLTDIDTKEPNDVVCNPNKITGKYFVGSIMGANILNKNSISGEKVNTKFTTNNKMGKITASAFVGGYMGYNLLYSEKNDRKAYGISRYFLSKFSQIDKSLKDSSLQGDELERKELSDKKKVLDKLDSIPDFTYETNEGYSEKVSGFKVNKATNFTLVISGNDKYDNENSLGGLEGEICIGGVVGYSDDDSNLYIKDVVNRIPVKAKSAIELRADEKEEKDRKDYRGKDFTYSYSGGIIGKVAQNTVLDNCSNDISAGISLKGTYTGGLCEVNDGKVINCKVYNLSNSNKDYVGGLCGINRNIIMNCSLDTKYIYGSNYTGGFASENFGTIKNVSVKSPRISASCDSDEEKEQGISGSIAAYNAGDIQLASDLLNVKIESDGSYVGSVTGINEGDILAEKEDEYITVTGKVYGYGTVGGIVGANLGNKNVKYYINKTNVQAEKGEAGGIVGVNKGEGGILSCINHGRVVAAKKGNAGGITATNNRVIKGCTNYGVVNAPNGNLGGIVALNNETGVVKQCLVKSENEDSKLEFSSFVNVGGIAADNYGTINDVEISDCEITDYSNSVKSNIGAVVGKNEKSGIVELSAGEIIKNCIVTTNVNDSNVGGVVGKNLGEIEGTYDETEDIPSTVISSKVGYANNSADVACIGGVAGYNQGSIKNCRVVNDITGRMGSSTTGLGGVCGFSGFLDSDSKNSASIKNCAFDGKVYGDGSADNILYMAGIVGNNYYNSTVEECRLGVKSDTNITGGKEETSYTYIGGIAGLNRGNVIACDNSEITTTVEIVGYSGMVGGIVGYNYEKGIVTGEIERKADEKKARKIATGKNWLALCKYYSNDCATGGIIGYSRSGSDINYAYNYGEARMEYRSESIAVGGIVGRCENREKTGMTVYACKNYGYIRSVSRAGGIFGMVKNNGVEFEDCTNYGEIYANRNSGGIVGCIYEVNMDEVYFDNCTNHGHIKTDEKAAGMFAYNDDTGRSGIVYLTGCINTGVIEGQKSNSRIAGIAVAGDISKDDKKTHFIECQNYGVPAGNDTAKSNFCGISYYTTKQSGTFEGCTDLGRSKRPIGYKEDSAKYNYYINDSSYTSHQEKSTTFEVLTPPNTNEKTGMLDTEATEYTKALWTFSNQYDIDIAVYDAKDMEKFYIVWCNNGSVKDEKSNEYYRTYTYTVSFYDDDSKELYTTNQIMSRGYYEPTKSLAKIDIPDSFDRDKISKITIHVSSVKNVTNSTINYISLRAFNWGDSSESLKACEGVSVDNEVEIDDNDTNAGKINVSKQSDGKYKLDDTSIKNLTYNPSFYMYSRDVKDYSNSSIRVPVYKELHEKIIRLNKERYIVNKKLDAPEGLVVSSKNGDYRFSFNEVENAYCYEVRYEIIDNGKVVRATEAYTVKGRTYYEFPYKDDMDGKEIVFYVRAISGNEALGLADGKKYSSLESSIKKNGVSSLPVPKAHLEMFDDSNFVAILDNKEDYLAKAGDIDTNNDGYKDCYIEVNLDNSKFTINPSDGYSSNIVTINNSYNSNCNISSVARPSKEDTYADSMTSVVGSCILSSMYLKDTKPYYNVSFDGFLGDTQDSLKYRISYSTISGVTRDYYVSADLMAYDSDLGMTISYSHANQSHVSGFNSVAILKDLPKDLSTRDKITAMSYLWCTQGYVIYYGHTVASNVTAEKLRSIEKDKNRYVVDGKKSVKKEMPIWSDEGKLNPGYIVYKNDDDDYTLIYSNTVNYSTDTSPYSVNKKVYTKESDKYVYDEGEIGIEPMPDIESYIDVDSENNKYTFYWDVNHEDEEEYQDAEYMVEITGETAKGEKVSLLTDKSVSINDIKDGGGYTFASAEQKWNYTKLNISVTRKGKVVSEGNLDDKTVSFPSTNSKNFKLKLKLSSLPIPNVSMKKNDAGEFDKNNLLYDISFSDIQNSTEKKDLAGYLIKVKSEDNTEKYYYAKVTEDKVSIPADVEDITDSLSITGEMCNVVIDFDSYKAGETVEISVAALADASDDSLYNNGIFSQTAQLVIPERLDVPDVTDLTAKTNKNGIVLSDSIAEIKASELEDGITFSMPKKSGEKYQIAMAIFDKKQSAGYDKVSKSGDGSEKSVGYWNSSSEDNAFNCIKTLVKKSDNTSNSLGSQGKLNFKLPSDIKWSDFSDCYIKIAIRSTADNEISSYWSDEDLVDNNTVDYCYIHIPKIQIEDVEMKQTTEIQYYNTLQGIVDDSREDYQIKTTALSFNEQDYANGYRIALSQNGVTGNHQIYFEKTQDSEYKVYWSKSGEIYNPKSDCIDNDNSVLVGKIDNSNEKLIMPLSQQYIINEFGGNNVSLNVIIKWDKDKSKFTIILPNIEQISTDKGQSFSDVNGCVSTQRAQIQAANHAESGSKINYADSTISLWTYGGGVAVISSIKE